jgi:hypothetical protein
MATADASSHPGQDHHDTPSLEHTFPKTAQAKLTSRVSLTCLWSRADRRVLIAVDPEVLVLVTAIGGSQTRRFLVDARGLDRNVMATGVRG